MAAYLVLDASGEAIDRIEWDGVTDYDPALVFGAGARLMPIQPADDGAQVDAEA